MNSVAKRLWNTSPASVAWAVRRRARKWTERLVWLPIQAGPAAGTQLLVPAVPKTFWSEMLAGTYDAFIYEALETRNLREAVCWDIGAHIGYHSLTFASLGAKVLSFEPNPHNVERLRAHLERNPTLARNIRPMVMAVSNRDGEVPFVQSADMMGESSGSHMAAALAPLAPANYANCERTVVSAVRMDSLIALGERAPEVIKIDIEGAEFLALQGASRLLAEKKPLLLIEVHHILLMFHLQQLLSQCGYSVHLLDEQNASPSRCFIMAAAD